MACGLLHSDQRDGMKVKKFRKESWWQEAGYIRALYLVKDLNGLLPSARKIGYNGLGLSDSLLSPLLCLGLNKQSAASHKRLSKSIGSQQ